MVRLVNCSLTYHSGDMEILRKSIQARNQSLDERKNLAGLSCLGQAERQRDTLGIGLRGETKGINKIQPINYIFLLSITGKVFE